MTKVADTADITVSVDGEEKVFPVSEFLGYLSWARLNGVYPNSIYIPYGSEVPAGPHSFNLAGSLATYKDEVGNDCYSPTSGTLELTVERPEFSVAFKHSGRIVDLTFGDQSPLVVINCTYTISSK